MSEIPDRGFLVQPFGGSSEFLPGPWIHRCGRFARLGHVLDRAKCMTSNQRPDNDKDVRLGAVEVLNH
jgi:hypothetical protein